METSELRIGNLISFRGYAREVKYIMPNKVKVDGAETYYFVSEYKPIQITEERLLKLGFEKDKEYFTKRYSRYEDEIISWLMVHYDKSMSRYVATVGNDNNIFAININSYLHIYQLQNLYFSLTGEGLILNGNIWEF